MIFDTLPFTNLGIASTYYGFICAFILSSTIFKKKFCNSLPRQFFRISCQDGWSSYLPRLGTNRPARIYNAVLFPIPLVPTNPSTYPIQGVGNRCSLNELGPNLCEISLLRSLGKLTIVNALKGHFLMHMPHPTHITSAIEQILEVGSTVTHYLPCMFNGQYLLHSWAHFFGLHFSLLIITIRRFVSSPNFFFFCIFYIL